LYKPVSELFLRRLEGFEPRNWGFIFPVSYHEAREDFVSELHFFLNITTVIDKIILLLLLQTTNLSCREQSFKDRLQNYKVHE